MKICKVMSNLGAWKKLQQDYSIEFKDIQVAIENLEVKKRLVTGPHSGDEILINDPHEISMGLGKYFRNLGWEQAVLDEYKYATLQAIKGDIGITWSFGGHTLNESDLFVKLPLFIQHRKIRLAVLLVPVMQVRGLIANRPGSFENLNRRITSLTPFPLKYPFAILGIGDTPAEPINIIELTTELDQFLIHTLGLSLIEMRIQTEKPAYDFKQQLPEPQKLAKELCAFANLNNGGVILIGVTDEGETRGIPESDIDEAQLRITQVAQSHCNPPPEIDCEVFEAPYHQQRRVIVVRIHELVRKPCMVENKIYIRRGSSASPANPDEVRALVLGRNTGSNLG